MSQMTTMQKAKSKMLLKHVFFANLLLSTKIEPVPGCQTAFTDMVMIGYDPKFIESLDPETVLFVLAHEVMHIVLKHGWRRQSRHPRRWNVACDFAINLQLQKMGFRLWRHCLVDTAYDGMSAEQIYDILPERKTGGGGDDDEDQGGLGDDVRDPPDMDPSERAVAERQVDQRVAQASSMARMAGKMPAELERLVAGVLNPPLPWQQLLRDFCTQMTREDETWGRRNRRFLTVYLPTRWSERMGEIVLIGDTSGSINDEVFAQIGSEIEEIVEQVKPERVRMVWADDAECSREEVFEAGEPIVLHPLGGGGTDMRKPLRFVEKYDPTVVVLVTDGYTPWPDGEPPYPLIVCCTTNAKVPIGHVVRLHP